MHRRVADMVYQAIQDTCLMRDIEAPEKRGQTQQGNPRRVITCRPCMKVLCDAGAKVAINGAVTHTFANPAGLMYEIMCVHYAEGCRVDSVPSVVFTWFKGCNWAVLQCAGCHVHLGWRFRGAMSFDGLITQRIMERTLDE